MFYPKRLDPIYAIIELMITEISSTEKILRYANRVEPIDTEHSETRLVENSYVGGASFFWRQRPTDLESSIAIFFTDSDEAVTTEKTERSKLPTILISDFSVGANFEGNRSPYDSIRAVLVLIATLTEITKHYGEMTHIARANERSQPFFKLLVDLGYYYYSDEKGTKVDAPKEWVPGFVLFASKYPSNNLPNLHSFVPDQFLASLLEIYKEISLPFRSSLRMRIGSWLRGN